MKKKANKKQVIWITAAVLVLALLCTVVAVWVDAAAATKNVARPNRPDADTGFYGWLTVPQEAIVAEAQIPEGGISIAPKEEKQFAVTVPKAGNYAIVLTYRTEENVVLDSTVTVCPTDGNGKSIGSVMTAVYSLWRDDTKDYALDRYGNEVTPAQKTLETDVTDYVRDHSSVDGDSVSFDFPAGEQSIRITSNSVGICIKQIRLVEKTKTPTWEEYQKRHAGNDYTGEPIIIEGESYAVKSDSYIRCKAESNSGVTPYNPYYKWLATVDGNAWNDVGQRVVWNFTVPQDGWYTLHFHYSQAGQQGQDSLRTIEIDGQVPYEELREVSFSYTGSSYAYRKLDGKVYLTAGRHTLGMYVEMPSMADVIDEVQKIITRVQEIGLSLQQIAGSDADSTRTWEIEKYMPGVTQELTDIQHQLGDIYDRMEQAYGYEPANSLNLQLSADILKQVLKRPDKLPAHTEEISVGSSSVTSYLAELINGWKTQSLSLDNIYLTGENEDLPNANGGFFTSAVNGVKRFAFSLVNRNTGYGTGTVSDEENVLTVWVNRSVPYVETLQMLADTRYAGYTDANGNKIKIQFSVMPDQNKLLLANASDTCPDVALGVSGDTPYQLGLREAAAELTQFDDFAEYVDGKFIDAAFEGYTYDSKIYALPETQQFYVLMYRKDIMERLELSIPQTWVDVANLMPTLRRNGMNFYMPLSSQTGTKSLDYISTFLYQTALAEGEDPAQILWSADGLNSTVNSEANIRAFEMLTDLYLLYGLQNNMPSFYNNFRYGVTPVGIGTFTNYIQMLYAAPEIADQWAIAPVPGVQAADGTIYNQMNTSDRSCMILESSDKKDAAWDFLKWWMSDETQTEFAETLQVKFGSAFVWNSANLNAFAQLAIPAADRRVILEQWQNAFNTRHTPSTYMVERSLSNAWYDVVNEHISVRSALNAAAVDIQLEQELKLKEFGYIDAKGTVLKPYKMDSIEQILSENREKGR